MQSVRCFPPRKPVSPCGLDGKPLGNLDDGYVATKASGRRKEQEYRVRENNNNGNKCLWFSSSLAKKKNRQLFLLHPAGSEYLVKSMVNMSLRSQWTQQVMSRV